MSRTRILSFAAVVGAVALIAGAFTSPATAASSKPVVGHCYNLTAAQAGPMSSTVHYVPCSGTHTTKTFAVLAAPSGVSFRNITPEAFGKIGSAACTPKLGTALGSTPEDRHLTAYGFLFFAPTPAQRAAGARWIRCDLILAGGRSLLPLPTNSSPVIQGPITDSTKRCLVGTDHLYTTCDHNHSYRSWAAYVLPGTGYRTQAQFTAAGSQRCPDAEWFSWPSKVGWTAGDHVLVCYDKTAA